MVPAYLGLFCTNVRTRPGSLEWMAASKSSMADRVPIAQR